MLHNWKVSTFIAAAVISAITAGKLVAMAALTIFLPIYAVSLASVFLIVFVVLASIVVPIGQSLLDKYEWATGVHGTPTIVKDDDKEHGEAA